MVFVSTKVWVMDRMNCLKCTTFTPGHPEAQNASILSVLSQTNGSPEGILF